MNSPERPGAQSNLDAFLRTTAENQLEHTFEVRQLYTQLDTILNDFGTKKRRARGGGQTVALDNAGRIRVGDIDYAVSVYKRRDKDGAFGEQSEYIGFNFSSKLVVPNVLRDVMTLTPDGALRVVVNNDGDVTTTNDIKLNDASDLAAAQGLYKQICANTDRLRSQRVATKWKREKYLKRAGVAVGGFAVVGTIVWGGSKISWDHVFDGDPEKFDRHDYSLPAEEATVVDYGHTETMLFSQALFDNPNLRADYVPQLGSWDRYDSQDATYTPNDGMREIVITTSKDNHFQTKDEGKPNCESQEIVGSAGLDSVLYAWTDFTDVDGTSRADELNVTYNKDGVRVCWTGEERNDDDDPRVVLQIVRAADRAD